MYRCSASLHYGSGMYAGWSRTAVAWLWSADLAQLLWLGCGVQILHNCHAPFSHLLCLEGRAGPGVRPAEPSGGWSGCGVGWALSVCSIWRMCFPWTASFWLQNTFVLDFLKNARSWQVIVGCDSPYKDILVHGLELEFQNVLTLFSI